MGQAFLSDNLPNIVKASTTQLTLASSANGLPTTITVGGQQFPLPSTLTLTTSSSPGPNALDTGSLGTIQLWYVYAIVNSSNFTVALIASQTGPGTGPSFTNAVGYYNAWKLVGAFYTDGSSLVGSVVSGIYTHASTGWMNYISTPGITNTLVTSLFKRNGPDLEGSFYMSLTGTPVGSFTITIPSGLTINTAVMAIAVGNTTVGRWTGVDITSYVTGDVTYNSTNTITFWYQNAVTGTMAALTPTVPVSWAGGNSLFGWFKLPIVGWNSTLL